MLAESVCNVASFLSGTQQSSTILNCLQATVTTAVFWPLSNSSKELWFALYADAWGMERLLMGHPSRLPCHAFMCHTYLDTPVRTRKHVSRRERKDDLSQKSWRAAGCTSTQAIVLIAFTLPLVSEGALCSIRQQQQHDAVSSATILRRQADCSDGCSG